MRAKNVTHTPLRHRCIDETRTAFRLRSSIFTEPPIERDDPIRTSEQTYLERAHTFAHTQSARILASHPHSFDRWLHRDIIPFSLFSTLVASFDVLYVAVYRLGTARSRAMQFAIVCVRSMFVCLIRLYATRSRVGVHSI